MKRLEHLVDGFWQVGQLALPFMMPLFNMLLVVEKSQRYLGVAPGVAWVLGIALELQGGTVLHLLMQVQAWNRSVANPPRAQAAQYRMAGKISVWYEMGIWFVFLAYVIISLLLVLIFEIYTGLAKYAPAVIVPMIASVYFLNATGMELRRLRAVVADDVLPAPAMAQPAMPPPSSMSYQNATVLPSLIKPASPTISMDVAGRNETVLAGLPPVFSRAQVEMRTGLAKTAAVGLIRVWLENGQVQMGSKRGEYVRCEM